MEEIFFFSSTLSTEMPSRVFIDRGKVPGEDHPRLRTSPRRF